MNMPSLMFERVPVSSQATNGGTCSPCVFYTRHKEKREKMTSCKSCRIFVELIYSRSIYYVVKHPVILVRPPVEQKVRRNKGIKIQLPFFFWIEAE